MASPAPTPFQVDTLINIKINHDGSNKKVKLPYSDLTPELFENKLRMALNISPSSSCHFERYSDSAGRFVVLNRHNLSVYKQLARAAKAKQKLKLRVVYHDADPVPAPLPAPEPHVTLREGQSVSNTASPASSPGPQPVSIEDAVEDPFALYRGAATARDATPEDIPDDVPLADVLSGKCTFDIGTYLKKEPMFDFSTFRTEHQELVKKHKASEEAKDKAKAEPTAAPALAGPSSATVPVPARVSRPPFTVACNNCREQIPNAHFHCSTCEWGDYDLCLQCVDNGVTCLNSDHWLIKRSVQNGMIVNSTTERIAPKNMNYSPAKPSASEPFASQTESVANQVLIVDAAVKAEKAEKAQKIEKIEKVEKTEKTDKAVKTEDTFKKFIMSRTCNNCIRESAESDFLHCTECADFDLCQQCFVANDHGHHPRHAFTAAVPGTVFSSTVQRFLPAGRGVRHNAICDKCDQFISGVRYKCMQCPDWDLCSECINTAEADHRNHRFTPLYEALPEIPATKISVYDNPANALHTGIYCDGPHCTGPNGNYRYIVGDRYKCAVCHNKDFCATCEASPTNKHNKTHPLIKFRTPVRHVSVTTTGEHGNGCAMPVMGDRRNCASSAKTTVSDLNLNKVQTVLDVKPSGSTTPFTNAVASAAAAAAAKVLPIHTKTRASRQSSKETLVEPRAEDLGAMFQRETIPDGTMFAPNFVFEQTWVLRNSGNVAWPAGSRVQFVSGDYMGHVDSTNPAGISELVSSSESTVCYEPLAPGAEFPFTVLLRTPPRTGKTISYWRLTTKGGIKFGDRLWCDVNVFDKEEEEKKVEKPAVTVTVREVSAEEPEPEATKAAQTAEEKPVYTSQMIFPKLEKESPGASVHGVWDEAEQEEQQEEASAASEEAEEFEEWADDDSDSGFMTDEEYDILDASDEEFLSPPRK